MDGIFRETTSLHEDVDSLSDDENSCCLSKRCKWTPTSNSDLASAERKMLVCVKCTLTKKFVQLPNGIKIWTVIANREARNKIPLVMVHGFGAGVGFWANNLEPLSKTRTLYAFDLLGFGRSSRPKFNRNPDLAEEQFVDSIEQWREALKIEKMVLLGHSFGGFLVASYALRYPDRLQSLVLADPWGFPRFDPNSERYTRIPLWIRAIIRLLECCACNPLCGVRTAGPLGPKLLKRIRRDFKGRFPEVEARHKNAVFNYIYHCNAGPPSGETGFARMNESVGYAINPMLERMAALSPDVPVTFIYGAESWMESSSGYEVQELLSNHRVEVHSIEGATHHLYVDGADRFHELVNRVCDVADDASD